MTKKIEPPSRLRASQLSLDLRRYRQTVETYQHILATLEHTLTSMNEHVEEIMITLTSTAYPTDRSVIEEEIMTLVEPIHTLPPETPRRERVELVLFQLTQRTSSRRPTDQKWNN
eukprot:GHVR01035484.1.p2 GENE.GHVR01035484.1~~GHVR01035484.1.p2  ORF type:complete len:115 (-),score=10.22 GHVR01035484.1:2085-2429(-)